MCGIFGLVTTQPQAINTHDVIRHLFLLSESRGKEAAGLALKTNNSFDVLKVPYSASKLLHSRIYREIIGKVDQASFVSCIGHARLVTNGALEENNNNQPVVRDKIVGVHNGIIVNDDILWQRHKDIQRQYQVDTEVFLALTAKYLAQNTPISEAVRKSYDEIEGTASTALMFEMYSGIVLSSNHGSLYTVYIPEQSLFIFASESYIIEQIINLLKLPVSTEDIKQIQDKEVVSVAPVSTEIVMTSSKDKGEDSSAVFQNTSTTITPTLHLEEVTHHTERMCIQKNAQLDFGLFQKLYNNSFADIQKINRCTKCILPATMPFIEFDKQGVCNYCRYYESIHTRGSVQLKNELSNITKKNPILFAFSGGRDSSYALHIMKEELNIPVVAYSYDWGMITDLGRRNQSRMCSKLSVEHIIVSADIARKRNNIRKNVLAWLNKPDLGTVPLFMAGDKQYFYYAHKISKQIRASHIMMSENYYERTHFKHGFCGVTFSETENSPYMMKRSDRLKILEYYFIAFLRNKKYLNTSLVDTFINYIAYYFLQHDYLYFYKYIPWDEKTVDEVLINKYNWETAPDTESTWRIGDGTAPFYNYIYFILAGFTENDTFRSNQIREGMLTREEALRLSIRDNKPRFESMKWYFDTINVDMERALNIIHKQPTLYKK